MLLSEPVLPAPALGRQVCVHHTCAQHCPSQRYAGHYNSAQEVSCRNDKRMYVVTNVQGEAVHVALRASAACLRFYPMYVCALYNILLEPLPNGRLSQQVCNRSMDAMAQAPSQGYTRGMEVKEYPLRQLHASNR